MPCATVVESSLETSGLELRSRGFLFYVESINGGESSLVHVVVMMEGRTWHPMFVCPEVHLQIQALSQHPLLTPLLHRQPGLRGKQGTDEQRPNAFGAVDKIQCVHMAPCPQDLGLQWKENIT